MRFDQNVWQRQTPQPGEAELFEQLVAMVQTAKRETLDVPVAFLEELIDACVLAASKAQIISEGNRAQPGSLYFPDEALEKDLQFITDTAVCLEKTIGLESEKSICEFIDHCTARNIGEKLNRLESDSPDLFAVIKQEGAA